MASSRRRPVRAREVRLADLAGVVGGRVVGDGDLRVRGIRTDSREVRPGDLFVCVPGHTVDGHDFAAGAVARGAVALVAERPAATEVETIIVDSVRAVVGPLAAAFFDHPSRDLTVVGVTGTNGKTTVAHLVAAAAGGGGHTAVALGSLSGVRTTPEAVELQRNLDRARDEGVGVVAVEVSSHALDQGRVAGTRFAVSVFTNLSPEHLDYHRTMDDYEAAKARLFDPSLSQAAVVNVDDPAGRRLASRLVIPCVEVSPSAATGVTFTSGSTSLDWRGGSLEVPLGGSFMVADVLLAAEAAVLCGVGEDAVRAGLRTVDPVPGRFEVVAGGSDGALVIVDYAHTPDALATTLDSARSLTPGRLTVVFGCGGDRDSGKRPVMGAIAAARADRVVVTSDNPRSEDPAAIATAIVGGIDHDRRSHVEIELDRRRAIFIALDGAEVGDVVVVAGKGHETTQDIGGVVTPFDDRAVVASLLAPGDRTP
jgi:UDP-N-acetylmuramoyl-L-alanyl-D-glutamate--2,6-diaminopimelate ligase